MDSNEVFPAHIRASSNGEKTIQTVGEHCVNVADYSSQCLSHVGLRANAYLAGILHDMGKFTDRFRRYITDASEGKPVVRGSVNHTFAGVRYAQTELARAADANPVMDLLTRDLVSYAVGSHHGQFDCVDEDGRDGFQYRMEKQDIDYEEAVQAFLSNAADRIRLDDQFARACRENTVLMEKIQMLAKCDEAGKSMEHLHFYLGCVARLLQSAVIDADRRDTAQFMQKITFPQHDANMRSIWEEELTYAEEKLLALDETSPINRARRDISDCCRQSAEGKRGVYRLNVPTGAGKTLSSLRFALAHAARWNMERIIFATPLLSILEQNAAVIREYIRDPSLILEHHSNVVQPEEKGNELNLSELYTDNWDAPIIITTLVQLLNTFASGKTSCIRRFHSLCNSVIVIDEVQSVPVRMLTLFNLTISFLSGICGATIVLCSATQPYLEGAEHPIAVAPTELVPYSKKIWDVFHRNDLVSGGKCRSDQLAQSILELSDGADSVLIICNKKRESERVFQELSTTCRCYHLSASMCMEHRRKVFARLTEHLPESSDGPLICVSTQVMEAGVDISFDCVIRLMAGMDSCVQAAGRCNRNGEKESGCVYILNCTDEKLTALEDIRRGKDATLELIYEFERDPDQYRGDLSSEEAIRHYYRNFYRSLPQKYQDDRIKGQTGTLFSLLSSNGAYVQSMSARNRRPHMLHQAFREAGRYFHVFDEETVDVIVPYGEGHHIVSELLSERAKYDSGYRRGLLRKAKGYTVTLYPEQKRELERRNAVIKAEGLDVYILSDGYYDADTGIVMEPRGNEYLGV